MPCFSSKEEFLSFIGSDGSLILVSPWRRVGGSRIFLHALASRDFNPAHIRGAFAKRSFFGGIVSHGIAVFSRAEGEFVELFPRHFGFPIEIIALGYKSMRYNAPLHKGAPYRYRFTVQGVKERKGRIDMECRIICESGKEIVAEALWSPSFIPHEKGCELAGFLAHKSYLRNVLEALSLVAMRATAVLAVLLLLLYGVYRFSSSDIARNACKYEYSCAAVP